MVLPVLSTHNLYHISSLYDIDSLYDIELGQSKQSLEIFKFFTSVQFTLLGGGQIFYHFSPYVIHNSAASRI